MNNSTIYLALGSNLGEREINLLTAIKLLSEKIKIEKTASFYETKPVGYTDQASFINTAIKGSTSLSPQELINFLKNIEIKIGRQERFRWGPREIDIDIIFYDEIILEEKDLIISHPRMHERDFVLRPIMDLNPDFIHPIFMKTVKELFLSLNEEQKSILRQIPINTSSNE